MTIVLQKVIASRKKGEPVYLISQNKLGKWSWRLLYGNNKRGGADKGFNTKQAAIKGAKAHQKASAKAKVIVK